MKDDSWFRETVRDQVGQIVRVKESILSDWSFAFYSKGIDPVAGLEPSAPLMQEIETRYYDEQIHRGAFVIPRFIRNLVGNESTRLSD
jgi:spermidine synthase